MGTSPDDANVSAPGSVAQEQPVRHENPGKWSLNYPELSWKSTTYISQSDWPRKGAKATKLTRGRDGIRNRIRHFALFDLNSQKRYFKEQGA
jgi:hypothetical protein